MNTKSLEVVHLSHAFGITDVLDDINLKIEAGQVIALVGPSGCGKTTLLHLCAGLTELRQGKITNSFDATAFMFQQPLLLPWKNTLDNIAIGLKAKRVARKTSEAASRNSGCVWGW